jgi:eukaryotic-like serine/threonine-protein kinase
VEQVLAGRYVLGDELGAGGMARVVRARDIVLDRWVAVKLLPAGVLDPTARERFRREARSSASFAHPNAVAVYDAGEDGGQLFIVMELVEGPSLAHVLAERGRLRVDDALHIADSVLAALAVAHAAGLVHRDIKPGNVLLGPNRQVKLADFGIARRLDDLAHDLTAVHTVLGTPRYTSPEQLAGQPATPASDLYAVGVVLFEMLVGTPPYDGPSAAVVAAAHHTAPIPDVTTWRTDVPPVVAAAITQALAKDPAARFPSATAMRGVLAGRTTAYPVAATAALPVGAPSTAAPAPDGPRGQNWWWVAVAALVIVGVAALVWATRDRGGADAVSSTSSPPASTVVTTVAPTAAPTSPPPTSPPPTAAPTTTQPPPTTAPPTTAPPTTPVSAATVDDVLAALVRNPTLFGEHTFEVVTMLARIDGRGNDAKQAGDLLDKLDHWVDDGEVDESAADLLRAALTPIADERDHQDG